MRSPPTDASGRFSPPCSESELLERARSLAGRCLGDLARSLSWPVPPDLRRRKGWAGELIERALGGTSGSEPEPDFPELGIELKTLPIGPDGRPGESTHVCSIAMYHAAGLQWQDSLVRRKLARVLWVPVEGDRAKPPGDRLVGTAILWSPSAEQERELRRDWEELMEFIALGQADRLTGRHGTHLQVRPKAANGRARTRATDATGAGVAALPRGFYLRPAFTAAILRSRYAGAPRP